jgi:hypothetical protein
VVRFSVFVAAGGLFCFGVTAAAGADPIGLTSGSFVLSAGSEIGSIDIAGTRGFSLKGPIDAAEGSVNILSACGFEHCLPGSSISLDGRLGGRAFPGGVVTLDGITHDDIGLAGSAASVYFTFTGKVLLPDFTGSPAVVTAPFRITGGAFTNDFPAQPAGIDSGHGTAMLWLTPRGGDDAPAWGLDDLRYEFSDAAPAPEPATLLLVGTGVLAAWRLRTRRGRAGPEGSGPS